MLTFYRACSLIMFGLLGGCVNQNAAPNPIRHGGDDFNICSNPQGRRYDTDDGSCHPGDFKVWQRFLHNGDKFWVKSIKECEDRQGRYWPWVS